MERDDFLNRIATRLGRDRLTTPPPRDVRGIPVTVVKMSREKRLARFKDELEAVGGHVDVCDTVDDVSDTLRTVLDELTPASIITWDRSEFDGWDVDWLWDERGAISCGAPGSVSRAAMLGAAVGVTLVDFAIADTGTIVVTASSSRPRSVSLLPTVHVAIVHEWQLVDRMGDVLQAFEAWSVADVPSSLHFITGPSRSADIENDLTIGVHGPAALHVIVRRG